MEQIPSNEKPQEEKSKGYDPPIPFRSTVNRERRKGGRLTVTGNVYHQGCPQDAPGTTFPLSFSQHLPDCEDGPYTRTYTIGGKGEPVDRGYLRGKPVVLIGVRCEKDSPSSLRVDVGGGFYLCIALTTLPPGASVSVPFPDNDIFIQAIGEKARVSVIVVPAGEVKIEEKTDG